MLNTNRTRKLGRWLLPLVFVAILVLDQWLKQLAYTHSWSHSYGWISFNLVKNTGATFGILQNMNAFLIWIYVIALGLIMFYYDKLKRGKVFLWFIVTGLLGNFIDRIRFGFVADFIDLGWWPVFNVADILIVSGVIGIILWNRKSL